MQIRLEGDDPVWPVGALNPAIRYEKTCIHEAAHAVVAMHFGETCAFLRADREDRLGSVGRTGLASPVPLMTHEQQIVFTLAGLVAESQVDPSPDGGLENHSTGWLLMFDEMPPEAHDLGHVALLLGLNSKADLLAGFDAIERQALEAAEVLRTLWPRVVRLATVLRDRGQLGALPILFAAETGRFMSSDPADVEVARASARALGLALGGNE